MFDLKKGLAVGSLLAALCLAPGAQAGGHFGRFGHPGYGYGGGYGYNNGFQGGRFCNRPGFNPYAGGFGNHYGPRYYNGGGYGYGGPVYAPQFRGPRFGGFHNRPGFRAYYGF